MSLLRRIETMRPDYCPKCGARDAYIDPDGDGRPECGKCGHHLLPPKRKPVSAPPPPIPTPDASVAQPEPVNEVAAPLEDAPPSPIETPPAPPTFAPDGVFRTPSGRDLSRYKPSMMLVDKDNATPWIIAMFGSAMEALHRKDYHETIRHLKRCLGDNRDFLDALIWLGRLEDDPEVRKKYLEHVLALQPANSQALRELMILRGELDPDAELNEFTEAEVRHIDGTTVSKARAIKCPRCGSSNVSDDDAEGAIVVCETCSYRFDKPKYAEGDSQSLMAALLKRRSQEVVWVVGSRTLKCNGCGAERTLGRSELSSECPFCGSRQVIEQDALGSLTQPDGIIPFRISRHVALERVKAATASRMERFKGFFVENRVKRTEISGVFLPFWVFDALVDVNHTYELVASSGREKSGKSTLFNLASAATSNYSSFAHAGSSRLMTEKFTDATMNFPVPAFTQPSVDLALRAGRFHYDQTVEYDPDYIAQHSAELYSIDFDKASLEMRSAISQAMRRKYHRDDGYYRTTSIMSMVVQASFRLMLVPMWAVTIFEKDGDVRPVLVNGQTGHVSLGRATKPR